MNASATDTLSAKALGQIEDCLMDWVVASLDERDSSQQRTVVYERDIAEQEASIEEAFSLHHQSPDPGERRKIEKSIT